MTAPSVGDEVLTPSEVAELLKHPGGPQWAMEQARTNRIPAFKAGRYWRFLRSDVEALIEQRKTGDPLQVQRRRRGARRPA